MPLLSLLASNPEAVRQLNIEQIVSTCGDGRLRDSSESQRELQAYLRQACVEDLSGYADYCLANSFAMGGQVLQDVVNELGRRLEYDVTNGRYQGTQATIGFDGIWKDPSGHGIVVEVKTTDAYRLSLDTVAKYRDRLLASGELEQPSSILLVVGRRETGELEAQVRGSRHAWDVRLISVDALLKLVRIKEGADSPDTIAKIRRLLMPLEYTRLDDLVDVVFATTQDVETSVAVERVRPDEAEGAQTATSPSGTWDFTPSSVIQAIRERIVAALGKSQCVGYVRKSRALYWDSDHRHRVVCTVSKRYLNQGAVKYWYAYHPQWNDFLKEGTESRFMLGCTDLDVAFAIPFEVIQSHLSEFHTTERRDGGGLYYHLKLVADGDQSYALQLPRSGSTLPMRQFEIPVGSPQQVDAV